VHELAITNSIVEIVSERSHGARVLRIVLEVGLLTAVEPEALRFCFEVVAAGTVAQDAVLDIRRPEGDELRIREMEVA
jgi:hydrogenase nickel incorporation protein HypA/HybF